MNKIIAVDVDLTVVDSVTPWVNWYKDLTGDDLGSLSSENNDLETLMKNHNDPMKFWRDPKLYDKLEAFEHAKIYLQKIHELGIGIIFVSSCIPEHEESKRHFIRRNFPYSKGFVSTSDKKFVRCDYFVDDYKKYCRDVSPHSKVFQIKSFLNSPSDEFPYVEWVEIYEFIKGDINGIG